MNDIIHLIRVQWDRSVAIASIVVGALALVLGYFGVSDSPYVAAQLPYFISGGLVGIFLLGLGGIFWLSADMRDEWRELRALRNLLDPGSTMTSARPFEAANGAVPSHEPAVLAAENAAPAPSRSRRKPISAGATSGTRTARTGAGPR